MHIVLFSANNVLKPHFVEDCDDFGDCSTQRDATSESLYAPGSSHMSSHNEELRILNVYGRGEGPLALDGNDALFTASKLETLNSLSADHREELTVQVGNHLLIHHPKERLPLLQLQHTPIESTHLYDSMCR